ncbi:MAG: hypothetical protein GC171_16150 [Terrimonas sp.]|nr:hypothetical protein [Terrimonas sp.]
MLLSFLKIRAIVNGKEIYPLANSNPIVIHFENNNPKIVITDGFHYTKPLELVYHQVHTYYFHVVCTIGDVQMFFGFIFMALFYLLGLATGFLFLKLACFFPVLYFLYVFYINKQDFIQLKAV